jgi:hypothetical protein
MLSTEYRKRLEFICSRIAKGEEVKLDDMVWAQKLAKANRSALEMMNRARREALNPNDHFYNALNLGSPDPQDHKAGFDTADEIVDWFRQEKTDDWRQRD